MITDNYGLYLKFNGEYDFTKYEAVFKNFTRTEKTHTSLKSADNSVSITLDHNTTLENKLRDLGDGGAEAYISKNGSRLFTGYVRRNFTFKNNGLVQNTPIELVSPSFYLKRKTTQTIKAVNSTVSTVLKLMFIAAGFEEADLTELPTITTVLPYILEESGSKTYHDLITTLLFEYGYILDFNTMGKPCAYPVTGNTTPSGTFKTGNEGNIHGTLQQTVKEEAYEKFSVQWTSVKVKENTNIFSDTQGATTTDKCEIEVAPLSYYGENEADSEGLYLEYSAEGADLLYAYNVSLDCTKHSDIVLQEFTDYGKKGFLKLYNTSSVNRMITKLDVNGTAILVDSTNVAKINNSDGQFAQTLEYNSSYIYDKDTADKFCNALANYYKYADFTYTIQSYDNFSIGAYVNVTDPETGTLFCRIVQKKVNEMTGQITYTLEGAGEYQSATVTTVSDRKSSGNGNTVGMMQTMFIQAKQLIDVANKYTLDLTPEYQVVSVNSSGVPFSSDDLQIEANLYFENSIVTGVTWSATVNDVEGVGSWLDNVFILPISAITGDNTVIKITATAQNQQRSTETITRTASSTIAKLYAESSWVQYDMGLTDNAVSVSVDGVITPTEIAATKVKRTSEGQFATDYGHIKAIIDDTWEYKVGEYEKDSGSGYDSQYTYNKRMTPFVLTIDGDALVKNTVALVFYYRHN